MMEEKVFELEITAVAYGGEGVGRLPDGRVVFLQNCWPGERVEAILTEEKSRFVRGEVRKILRPSPERIVPCCPAFPLCPGCVFQSCSYALELEWKQRQLARFLRRFLPEEKLRAPLASSHRFGWRNRLKLACEEGVSGYRGWDNRTLVPVRRCELAEESLNELLAGIAVPESGSLFLRSFAGRGCAVPENSDELLRDEIPGWGSFLVPARGFFQTNPEIASELIRRTVETLKKHKVRSLLELYCGAGVFSLSAVGELPELSASGIELEGPSIEAAKANAAERGVSERCTFVSGDAAKFRKILPCSRRFDAILVDPPRSGLGPKMTEELLKFRAPLLIYISCGPDTLQRDLEKLGTRYCVEEAGLLDMFPCTAHFEVFTVLARIEKKHE